MPRHVLIVCVVFRVGGAADPREADVQILLHFTEELSESFVELCTAHKPYSQDSVSVFVSARHGLWENAKFLKSCLNGFPEGKGHKGVGLGCVWEGSGREMVTDGGHGRREGEGRPDRLESRQGAKVRGPHHSGP